MSGGVSLVRHVHKELVSPADEPPNIPVTKELVVSTSPPIHAVIILELRKIFDESIGPKDGHVIKPSVPRSCRKHDPVIVLGNLIECLNPGTSSDKSLLVEDEESIFALLVLVDVVPGVNLYDCSHGRVWVSCHPNLHEDVLPIELIALLSRGDDNDVPWCFVLKVVANRGMAFADAHTPTEDATVVHFGYSLFLVWLQLEWQISSLVVSCLITPNHVMSAPHGRVSATVSPRKVVSVLIDRIAMPLVYADELSASY
jgi:hypothetical protein